MSVSDIIALTGVIVFIVQSVLLYWYANETKKLREDANAQTAVFTEQVKTSVKQNELMAQQLEAMTKAHQLQVELVEASETAAFTFQMVANHDGRLHVKMESLNLNVHLQEFRSNARDFTINFFNNSDRYLFKLHFTAAPGVIYFGIRYETKRGQSKTITYVYDMRDSSSRIEKGYNINLLEASPFRF